MTLYATRNLVGPNGENVRAHSPIPAAWPVDHPFVAECVQYGWIVNEAPLETDVPTEVRRVDAGGKGQRVRDARAEA